MIDMVAPDQLPKLPTPTVSDQYTANLASTQQKEGSMHSVTLAQVFNKPDLFPTPITSDYKNGKSSAGYGLNLPETAKTLMPTPTTRDYKDGSQPHERDGKVQTDTVARAVFNSGEINLPTPTASDWKGANHSGSGSASSRGISTVTENLLKTPIAKEGLNGNTQTTSIKKGQLWLSNDVQDISLGNGLREPDRNINLGDYHEIQWGKFEPAIRRWEAIIGRPAPEPTKPDGRDNAHRLSSKFTEWMMGLPDGWITDIGLKRNDELKACGNGVVPQQAELALSLLGIKEILERN
jgi:DNA (cytosine-5)-methyltransferase 1